MLDLKTDTKGPHSLMRTAAVPSTTFEAAYARRAHGPGFCHDEALARNR